MNTCKDCGHQFELNYCNNCGQKASVRRIELNWLIHELPHAIWHIEKGFLYNVVELFKRPGYAIADYVAGKRKKFYHPISYLLIIIALMFLVLHYLGANWYDPIQDKGMSADRSAFWKDYDASQQLWINQGDYLKFLLIYLPGSAFLFWVWQKITQQNYNYAESLVTAFFSTAQMLLPQLLFFFAASLIDKTFITRILDPITDSILIIALFFFQFYQLAGNHLRKPLRMVLSMIFAAGLWAWINLALMIQFNWINPGDK